MSTANELQQQITQAEAALNALREKLNQEQNAERTKAVANVKEAIQKFGLTAAELGLTAPKGKNKSTAQKSTRLDKGVAVKPKYVDPKTGTTWTGRGRMPVWLQTNISAGKTKEDYLIAQ
jgi:DNA-binding protein H-NS